MFQIAELVASCTPLGDSRTSFDQPLAKIVAEYVGCSQSFSERVKLRLTEHLFSSTPLNEDVARLVAEYVKGDENAFGAKEWQEYYGVDVGPELPFSKDLIDWWLDTDPLEPSKSIYDTHLPPVLRPQFITNIKTKEAFSLKSLGQIVAAPKKGKAVRYDTDDLLALQQHENTPAGPACLLVMRKGVLYRNYIGRYDDATYEKQKNAFKNLNATIKSDIRYVSETSALDLATIVFTRYITTGEFHPDDTCVEGSSNKDGRQLIFGACKEKSLPTPHQQAFHVSVGGFEERFRLRVGIIDLNLGGVGIVAMRKFTVASRK